jgi:hypothetical protein
MVSIGNVVFFQKFLESFNFVLKVARSYTISMFTTGLVFGFLPMIILLFYWFGVYHITPEMS